MANPQLEEGYTAIANEILEQLYKRYLSPNQWQVILCVARKTYGFRKKLDFISTSQISQETGLCSSVISRVLNSLQAAKMIVREGRNIGIQKDWEKWLPVTKRPRNFSNAANISHMANSEANVSNAANNEKLAKLSTKISQTVNGVSNAANKSLAMRLNTKEKKETTTKETYTKEKDGSRCVPKKTFEEYREELRGRFKDLDFNTEYEKFNLYWSGGRRKCKNPSLALLNWMLKAQEIKQEKTNELNQRRTQGNPAGGKAGPGTANAGGDRTSKITASLKKFGVG